MKTSLAHISTILLLLFCCIGAFAMQPVTDPTELNNRLSAFARNLKSIESDFVQTKHIDIFNEDVISNGTFLYYDGSKICLDYTRPTAYRMVINGNKLMTISNGQKSVVTLKSNAMMNEMQSMISACMTGNLSAISADFNLTYTQDDTRYAITVVPRKQAVRQYIARIEIWLNKTDMAVTELIFHENGTDYTRYVFKNRKFNTLKTNDPRLAIH